MDMKSRLQYFLITFLMVTATVPAVHASGIMVTFEVSPPPLHSQIMAHQNYIFNVTIENEGVKMVPGRPLDPKVGVIQYTGKVIVSLELTLLAFGGYSFGGASSGYTIKLDRVELNTTIPMPSNGTTVSLSFNHLFDNDAFDYGVKPYENVEVTAKVSTYFELYNWTVGLEQPFKGPVAGESRTTYRLLDETKIAYVEGKLMDMAAEIKPLMSIRNPEYVNATFYLQLLDQMNDTIQARDYFSALKTYERYDEKHRASLIDKLMNEAYASITRAETVKTLEQRIRVLEADVDQLLSKYATLSQTYQRKQAELEEAKQSLTTAITAVFLASIAFFFLGHRTATGKLFGRGRTDQGVDGDEAAPGVR
jgi:hypothetical protein